MKKIFFIFGGLIIVALVIFYINLVFKVNYLELYDKNKEIKIEYKGLKDARDFVFDDKGNLYIAFKSQILFIDALGNSNIILKDIKLDINSIDWYKGTLYFSSSKEVYSYNIMDKDMHCLINDLPNVGDYKKSLIKIKGNNMFITIGAATNSGVVGEDNVWVKDNPLFYDLTPFAITLAKINFGISKTGAFAPYGISNNNEIQPNNFPGNSSVLIYNLTIGLSESYAWGIRNIEGLDYNSKGEIIAVVGGIEERGLRPIKGDSDYIYKIDKGVWYGFPDFTGGDPVTSPRFSLDMDKCQKMLLQVEPSSNPPAPIYVYKNISALGTLAIDKTGVISNLNTKYLYDRKGNIVYSLDDKQILREEIKFARNNYINSIKFFNSSLYLLDNKSGYLEAVSKKERNNSQKLNNIPLNK